MADSHGEAKGQQGRRPYAKRKAVSTAELFRRSTRPPLLRNWFRWSSLLSALYLIVSRIALPRVGSGDRCAAECDRGRSGGEAQKLKDAIRKPR